MTILIYPIKQNDAMITHHYIISKENSIFIGNLNIKYIYFGNYYKIKFFWDKFNLYLKYKETRFHTLTIK